MYLEIWKYLISSLHLCSCSLLLQNSSFWACLRTFSSWILRALILGFTSTCKLGSTFFCKIERSFQSMFQQALSFLTINQVLKFLTYFVLESMSPSLHVHFLCIWIVELALTEFTIKTNSFALFISHFLNIFMSCNNKMEIKPSYLS